MAYETGSYATLEQLVTALKVFAEANGWTTDEFSDFRGGKRLSHHNADGVYLHWYSANNIQVNCSYQNSNGSYHGNYLTGLVVHAATGYDSTKHPGWQPGVPISSYSLPNINQSTRMIHTTGQLPFYGIYHFISLQRSLCIILDTGGQTSAYIFLNKIFQFSGCDISYILTAPKGAVDNTNNLYPPFYTCDQFDYYFQYYDTTAILSNGQWNKKHVNYEGYWIAQCNSPYVTSSSTKSFSDLITQTRPSGVNGSNPLVPVLLFKRVSNIFRPVGAVEHLAITNASLYSNMQEIQTTSGAWRVAKLTTNGSRDIAIRSDL